MDSIVRALIQSIDNGLLKAQWYGKEPDDYYLEECKDWLKTAGIYLDEIQRQSKNKSTNSI